MTAIRDLKGSKTVLIIAHRMSTITHCDRIYAIDQGEILNSGKPEEFGIS